MYLCSNANNITKITIITNTMFIMITIIITTTTTTTTTTTR
jgi:preprotein translocase subunit SecG